MNKYVIGLDNGGTVIKAAVFNLEGKELGVVSRKTPITTPRSGYTERDMELLWLKNCECLKEVISNTGINNSDIAGIAVCGHGKGLYLWGKNNAPAYNGIVSTDNRAWEYPLKWKEDGTFDRLYPQLCQQIIACQQVSLLAWMKDHEKEVYENIEWIFSVKDYIRFRLTGEAYSEATDISGSGLMDVRNACFDKEILEQFGIEEVFDRLAPIKYSYENCGVITESAAELTGLKLGTPVAGGMFDIDACAIAMDITLPEQLCTITGTWSINEFINPEPITGTSIAMNSLYAVPGFYLLEECSATSAGNLDWVIKNCFGDEEMRDDKDLYQKINEMVDSVSPDECEVYYLPFLYGSNTHPLAKACFIGLTTFHTKSHMLRAVFEGIAFSHRMHIEKLLSEREAPDAIRLAGGAGNSLIWVQIFADVLGYPIETVTGVTELGAMGAAMAAAVAGGSFNDYTAAAKAMVRVGEPIIPNPDKVKIYEAKYEKYAALTKALDTVWDRFTV